MAARYEFTVSKDSLMKVITNFNNRQTADQIDSVFYVDKGSPYFCEGYILDQRNNDKYIVLIPTPSGNPIELLLISVGDISTKEYRIVNQRPENKKRNQGKKDGHQEFRGTCVGSSWSSL